MADGNTVAGGRYMGADGRLHDAHGKYLDGDDTDAKVKAEQRQAAGTSGDEVAAPKARRGRKKDK